VEGDVDADTLDCEHRQGMGGKKRRRRNRKTHSEKKEVEKTDDVWKGIFAGVLPKVAMGGDEHMRKKGGVSGRRTKRIKMQKSLVVTRSFEKWGAVKRMPDRNE